MTTAVRTQPDPVRQTRERIDQIDRLIAEANQAIETARTDIETAKARREAVKARGEPGELWKVDQAILDAEAAIAQRELQIKRLQPEREALPGILVDWDRRASEADRLRVEIEGYERLAVLERQHAALAEAAEQHESWARTNAGAPQPPRYMRAVGRSRGSGEVDQLALAVSCLRQKRERLAEIERSLQK